MNVKKNQTGPFHFDFNDGETVEIHHEQGDAIAGWEWFKEYDDGEDDYLEGSLWFDRSVYKWRGSVLVDYDGASELPEAVFAALELLGVDVSECKL